MPGALIPQPRRKPPPPPLPTAEELAALQAPTRPRAGHRRGAAPLPSLEQLQELAAPDGGSDVTLVNPEVFSVLERYKQAERGATKKAFGRMFSTRPGAAAVAPSVAATPQQLQAAGTTIGLVAQIADVTAKLAAMDATAEGATKSQQDAAGNRARAAVWEKSGVPVDMRPLRSGVLGAELAANRAAFQAERLQAREVAQAKTDKANRGLVTKERAEKASLPESDAGEALASGGILKALGGVMPEITALEGLVLTGGAAQIAVAAYQRSLAATDPLVKSLGMASAGLGGALSVLDAVMQFKLVMKHDEARAGLEKALRSPRPEDRARDIALGGAAEVAMFKSAIATGKSAGATLSAMGGLLFATPVGPILKIIGSAISASLTVADVSKDSYQAGKVAEKEFESLYHGDAEESAEYVLRYGAEHRAENLLRKARGQDANVLKALEVYEITPADLARTGDAELRAKIIKHQSVATKNIGTRVSEDVAGLGIGEYFSDAGGAMVQHYRADIAERTARAKDEMLYGEGVTGKRHNLTKVRAKAFFRTGNAVDEERRAQLEILKIKIAKRNHGLDPKTLELVKALLQPQSYYQQLKADAARKVANVKLFGPGTSISSPMAPPS